MTWPTPAHDGQPCWAATPSWTLMITLSPWQRLQVRHVQPMFYQNPHILVTCLQWRNPIVGVANTHSSCGHGETRGQLKPVVHYLSIFASSWPSANAPTTPTCSTCGVVPFAMPTQIEGLESCCQIHGPSQQVSMVLCSECVWHLPWCHHCAAEAVYKSCWSCPHSIDLWDIESNNRDTGQTLYLSLFLRTQNMLPKPCPHNIISNLW